MKRHLLLTLLTLVACLAFCLPSSARVVLGDEQPRRYLPLLKDRRIALYSNQTGQLSNGRHILDELLRRRQDVVCIYSPEHGFRGTASAGERVQNSVDPATGIPIISLYGKQKAPTQDEMEQFDVLVVDIQDVGLRYYTYYVTMIHLMDACAAADKEVVILDRPNPNGHMVDGPVLDMRYRSGVGWLPIPVMHGLTLGELALMANGEGWLQDGLRCRLAVVPCRGYRHSTRTDIPVAPSPNLPNLRSVLLYPSLCYFEATPVSLGRGTDKPFQCYGHPAMAGFPFDFTPQSRPGAANPPCEGQLCHGRDLSQMPLDSLYRKGVDLTYLIEAWQATGRSEKFFTSFFEKLIGDGTIRQQILAGRTAAEIRQGWQADVARFKAQRRKYLLYAE